MADLEAKEVVAINGLEMLMEAEKTDKSRIRYKL